MSSDTEITQGEETAIQSLLVNSAPIDPFVKSHINSLASALGGPDHTRPDRPYVLGDDALACLRDLKRWLKAFDEKLNRLDVARSITNSSLLTYDLIQILLDWEESHKSASYAPGEMSKGDKIALAALELLVPLSWPLELEGPRNTRQNNAHKPHLELAQVEFKKAVLGTRRGGVLSSTMRITLPCLALNVSERTARDEGIVKLCLYLLRNIARIEPPNSDNGINESRSSTIIMFAKTHAFEYVSTLASGIGSDLENVDVCLLEILFFLLRGIAVEDIMRERALKESPRNDENTPLAKYLKLENMRDARPSRNTRHNRFGTMTSIVLPKDNTRLTVSGQAAAVNEGSALQKLDASKKWRRPHAPSRVKTTTFDRRVYVSEEASKCLKIFIEDFLAAAFNPLFIKIRKEIERESSRLCEENRMHFLYLVSWFLKASTSALHIRSGKSPSTFGEVAGVLDHSSLVVVIRMLREASEQKKWTELKCAMGCFQTIVVTINEMWRSTIEEEREIAENMISRLFYEETTLDLLASLPRLVCNLSFGFVDSCSELVHVVLKVLERYSKEHERIFIRKKTRGRRKRAPKKSDITGIVFDTDDTARATSDADMSADEGSAEGELEEEEEQIQEERSKEKAFEFSLFEAKFVTQSSVDLFRRLLENYEELTNDQIKRSVSFFYRVFVKNRQEVLLFRMDFMFLLYRCLDPDTGIPRSKAARRDLESFMKYYIKKLRRMLQDRPALYVELLFTKMNDTVHFLQNGYDKEKKIARRRRTNEQEISKKKIAAISKTSTHVPGAEYEHRADSFALYGDEISSIANNELFIGEDASDIE
ncbi:timeless protein-domain-containing protein [Dipodascopsis tothii]|uniref:timeless protein-domain-containing protein n=1 Tax=Dipodascopsis tothii TaxID=44089 RepID=UPI0034CDD67C